MLVIRTGRNRVRDASATAASFIAALPLQSRWRTARSGCRFREIKTDQSDETNLRIDVERGSPAVGEECHARVRHFQKGEDQRAEQSQRDRAEQNDEWIAEAVELRGQHQEDENDGERKRRQKFASFRAQAGAIRRCNR